jgi:hypothetical protein
MSLLSGTSFSLLAALLGSALALEGPPAEGNFNMEVRVVGIDGKPVEKSTVGIWRLVPEQERREKEADPKKAGFLWHEPGTDRVWEGVDGAATGGRWERFNQAPGTYRATAHLGHDGTGTPVGISEPLLLDGSRENATLTVRLQAGPTVSFLCVDAASSKPVTGTRITLVREDSVLPPSWSWTSPSSGEDGRVVIENLPPGTYRMKGSCRAWYPEDIEYLAAEDGRKLVIPAEIDQVLQVAMNGRPLDQAEIERRWGWVADGTVTDEAGRPVAGAEVRVATGWGTLRGGGRTKTDANGRFTLRFAEGWMSPDQANVQAAVFMAIKEGYVEKSRSRPVRHLMARRMPDAGSRLGYKPEEIVLKGQPCRIDFVLADPARIDVELLGPADATLDVAGQNEALRGLSSVQVSPKRWDLLPGQSWQFVLYHRKERPAVRSLPITLPKAGRYRAALRLTEDEKRGVDLLEIVNVTGPDGEDMKIKVVGDDPLTRPPVSEALQERGRDILKRMAEANSAWLGRPPKEAGRYQYRFRFAGEEGQTYEVGAAPVAGVVRRGISHYSIVHHLAANPAEATFRQVEVGDDRITLAYTLKQPACVSAGNGVLGTWHGFFSKGAREGVLVLDARRFTPLESRSDGLVETFSQYVAVGKSGFAPLAIRVQLGNQMRFGWTFQVVEPGIWLFASGYSEDGDVVAQVDQVRVNGAAAKLVTQGEPPARKPH